MVALKKIDSNDTNTRYAEETSIGILSGSPVWYALEPNSFNNFGGENTLTARQPINNSRQRQKGAITDLTAAGSLEQDFTQTNSQRLFQGFLFADFRAKTEQTVSAAAADTLTVSDGSKFAVGDLVIGSGFSNSANNTVFEVSAISTDDLTVTGAVAESPGADAKLVVVNTSAGSADLDVDATGTLPAITSTTLDFTDLGLTVGEWVYVGGDATSAQFVTAANNGFKRVASIAANRLEFDKSAATMVDETGTGLAIKIYFGRFLRNEQRALIKRRTYQIERTLGKPNDTDANDQAEYLVGCVPSEFDFNFSEGAKALSTLAFMALKSEVTSVADGLKTGTRPALVASDMYNTATDIAEIKMNIWQAGNENPSALFGYVSQLQLKINNNISGNKALGVLGAFEMTAGTFEVSGSVEAYFTDVASVEAVNANSDVTMHVALVQNNHGMIIDLPLIALGDGRLTVALNEPIKIPLNMDASDASKLNSALDYTIGMMFFDYLPTMAAL